MADPYGLQLSGLPPDYALEAQGINSKRAIWEALLAQGMQPVQDQQTRGRFAIQNSPLQGIAKVLQAYLGAKGIKSGDDEIKAVVGKAMGSRDAIDSAWGGASSGIDSVSSAIANNAAPRMPPQPSIPPAEAGPPIMPFTPSAGGTALGGGNGVVGGAAGYGATGSQAPGAAQPMMEPAPVVPPLDAPKIAPTVDVVGRPEQTTKIPTRESFMMEAMAVAKKTGRPLREILASPLAQMKMKQIEELSKPFNLNEGEKRFSGDAMIAEGSPKLTDRQRNIIGIPNANAAQIEQEKLYRAKELADTKVDHSIPANWEASLPQGADRSAADPAGTFRMAGADGQKDVYAAEFQNGKVVGYKKLDNAPKVSVTATANSTQKGDNKYAEERMKGRADAMATLDKSAEGAFKNMQAIDRFLEASKKGTEGGAQPIISMTQNFLTSFGFKAGELKDVRQMEQALGQIQVNQIAEFGARGLTDNDMKVLRLALPKIETDKASRDAVAAIVKKSYASQIAEWENQRAEEARIYPDLAGKIPEPAWYKQYKKIPPVKDTPNTGQGGGGWSVVK